jgi:predicted transcriptional regulator of viral defense system
LVEYTNRLGDKTLGSRLGYLLGLLGRAVSPCDGVPAPVDGPATPQLIRSTSSVKLDPGRLRQGRRDALWRIDINVPFEELRGEGIG